jgi:hypothetical protein
MVMTVGISALFGLALGWRFNVFILIPTIILGVVGATIIAAARGDQAWSVVLIIILAATTVQVSYLVGGMAQAILARHVPLEKTADVALIIREHMEVVGSDGEHVGTVDHTENADRIVLTGDDPKAGGKPHLISAEWVDYVDSKVHLNKPSVKAVSEWRIAA